MLKLQLNFNRDELTKLLAAALRVWSNSAPFDSVTINANADGTVSGYAFLRKGGKTTSVNLSHEVISAGIVEASARAGSPIDKNSLVFKHIEARGYGGGSSVSATANAASPEQAQAQASEAQSQANPGRASFPGQVTVQFSQDELRELILSATRRAGLTPSYVTVSYDEKQGASASISVKTANNSTGTVNQSPSELIATLTEELQAQGYTVAPSASLQEGTSAFHFTYTSGGFGSRSGTSLRVTLCGLPV